MARDDAKTFKFEVDPKSDLPLWVQLRNRLAHLITNGFYKPGDQLPTVRALAADISINYNTVNKAYLDLKSQGYIESSRGRGAFVREVDVEVDKEYSQQVGMIMDECVASCRELGMSLDDIAKCMDAKILQIKRGEGLANPEDESGGRIITIEIGGSEHASEAGA